MTQQPDRAYRIIVVDDDREVRDSLSQLLQAAGWQVESLASASGVMERQEAVHPDVILSDVRMPGQSGLELLQQITQRTGPPVVLISAHGDIPMAVKAMQDGAYSFLEKPYDPRRLLTVLKHAAENYRLTRDAERLKARLAQLSGLDRVLLGETPSIRALREDILDLAETGVPVMLLGETGTGKELVARALHDLSPRSGGPFVAVNCAAIPVQHFETAMFGEAGGAPGTLAGANGGTLFLDEIGACPEPVQAKLLRVIETQEFLPLGAEASMRIDIRIVSASNEQLDDAVDAGKFREDLLYRLNTMILTLPALRDHREDIGLLFTHFLETFSSVYEVTVPDLSAEDFTALLAHEWPGNVRELRHAAERRILAARRGRGSVAQAIRPDGDPAEVPDTLREAVAAFERQLIAKAIRTHNGRMDATAEALGIGRRTLNEKIVKLGLNKDQLL